jgi:hypothetical protein
VTIDHELVALNPTARFQARKIGPGTGLRKTLTPNNLTGEDLSEVA